MTPVQYRKPTARRLTTLSEPAVLKHRGGQKKGTEKKIDNGRRRKKMVSGASNPSDLGKVMLCYVQ